MPSMELRARLLALAQETLQQVELNDSEPLPEREGMTRYDQLVPGQKGTALYNPMRDERITGLASFPLAVAALEADPQFLAIADASQARRVVLQFTYDFLERQTDSDLNESAFTTTWSSFQQELRTPDWTYLGICYLENFETDADAVALCDGVTIYNRSAYRFREKGWSDFQIEKLYEDWQGSGLQVLVVEEKIPKTPRNMVFANTGQEWSTADRMVRALRLAAEGDVHIGGGPQMLGRVLTTRSAGSGFSPSGGAAMQGTMARWPGAKYSLAAADAPRVQALYAQLKLIESMGEATQYNLNLALRSFMSSYDRLPPQNDTKLVDLITATEALLGTGAEISFRLSFYIASILAGDDIERVEIFGEMRTFYDTRSKVVHGGTLAAKHRAHLKNYPALRNYVRRLLLAYMHLATTSGHAYDPDSLRRSLDTILQDAQQRSALRAAMGLE
jgi:Apea-like HEPN